MKLYNWFFNFCAGNPEDIDKKLKWYHYLNLLIKIAEPIIGIFLLFTSYKTYGYILIGCFLFEIYMYFDLKRRYEQYKLFKNVIRKGKI